MKIGGATSAYLAALILSAAFVASRAETTEATTTAAGCCGVKKVSTGAWSTHTFSSGVTLGSYGVYVLDNSSDYATLPDPNCIDGCKYSLFGDTNSDARYCFHSEKTTIVSPSTCENENVTAAVDELANEIAIAAGNLNLSNETLETFNDALKNDSDLNDFLGEDLLGRRARRSVDNIFGGVSDDDAKVEETSSPLLAVEAVVQRVLRDGEARHIRALCHILPVTVMKSARTAEKIAVLDKCSDMTDNKSQNVLKMSEVFVYII